MKKLLALCVSLAVFAATAIEDAAAATFQITIPEGYTLARIGMLLEEKGVCSTEDLIAAAQQGDFSDFPLIAAQPAGTGRCFKLEGYLFPDTYEFYTGETPDAILRKLLSNTEKRLSQELRQAIAASGFTVDEAVALASIIEKEANGPAAMPDISAVLHNRLDVEMQLQCDVTINYVEGAVKPFITGDINRYNSAYNTYKCPALPAGPICNPGMAAIQAAISPSDISALYFATDQQKNYYYADTWEDHLQNLKAIQKVNGAGGEKSQGPGQPRPKLANKGSSR